MEKRLIVFLILSAVIFWGSAYIINKIYPPPPPEMQNQTATNIPSPSPTTQAPTVQNPPSQSAIVSPSQAAPVTQAQARQIKVKTDQWRAVLSNQGGVITEWTMTGFADGKLIDAPNGVNLVSAKTSQEVGAPFRFYIPSDPALEKELNTAHYEVKNALDSELIVNKGEKKDVSFIYVGNGIEAIKTITFKGLGADNGSGFDFDFQASVRRNGNPVDAMIAIGPNFGDQNVTNVGIYKHAPQLTYAIGTSVERETADGLKNLPAHPTAASVTWAAVDDNYFAMAIVPARPVAASRLVKDQFVSIAIGVNQGEINHVYAGPKDLNLLGQVSTRFDLASKGSQLEDIVSYGWLNFMRVILKPIAQFMLRALREINKITHNFGWSIVIFTILLNMLFFPLRWRSSVAMKRAAAMQPKMKELQEKMKKLDKNDPRMLDLQKEQIALMKDGNPLMGCLPLLLQMPFFMAVFAILTVSIEVRNAPFFAWLTDLSSPDPYWVLPILMCVTMIAQTALTPSPADPMQKKIQYIMPIGLTYFFFRSAPAGLVLYWMVGNLVGVVQQFIINRLNPPNNPNAANSSETGNSNQGSAKGKKPRAALANS